MEDKNKPAQKIALHEGRDEGLWIKWYDRAKKCRLDDGSLVKFLTELVENYEHDYGTIVRAMSAAAIAGANAIGNSPQGGITGFQHGCFVMDFLAREQFVYNKLGFYIRDLDDLLYPQYAYKFNGVTIDSETADKLKGMARRMLEQPDHHSAPEVKAWWEALADGIFPNWIRVGGGAE